MGAFSDFQDKILPETAENRELPLSGTTSVVEEPVAGGQKQYLSFSELMGQVFPEAPIQEQAIPQAEVPLEAPYTINKAVRPSFVDSISDAEAASLRQQYPADIGNMTSSANPSPHWLAREGQSSTPNPFNLPPYLQNPSNTPSLSIADPRIDPRSLPIQEQQGLADQLAMEEDVAASQSGVIREDPKELPFEVPIIPNAAGIAEVVMHIGSTIPGIIPASIHEGMAPDEKERTYTNWFEGVGRKLQEHYSYPIQTGSGKKQLEAFGDLFDDVYRHPAYWAFGKGQKAWEFFTGDEPVVDSKGNVRKNLSTTEKKIAGLIVATVETAPLLFPFLGKKGRATEKKPGESGIPEWDYSGKFSNKVDSSLSMAELKGATSIQEAMTAINIAEGIIVKRGKELSLELGRGGLEHLQSRLKAMQKQYKVPSGQKSGIGKLKEDISNVILKSIKTIQDKIRNIMTGREGMKMPQPGMYREKRGFGKDAVTLEMTQGKGEFVPPPRFKHPVTERTIVTPEPKQPTPKRKPFQLPPVKVTAKREPLTPQKTDSELQASVRATLLETERLMALRRKGKTKPTVLESSGRTIITPAPESKVKPSTALTVIPEKKPDFELVGDRELTIEERINKAEELVRKKAVRLKLAMSADPPEPIIIEQEAKGLNQLNSMLANLQKGVEPKQGRMEFEEPVKKQPKLELDPEQKAAAKRDFDEREKVKGQEDRGYSKQDVLAFNEMDAIQQTKVEAGEDKIAKLEESKEGASVHVKAAIDQEIAEINDRIEASIATMDKVRSQMRSRAFVAELPFDAENPKAVPVTPEKPVKPKSAKEKVKAKVKAKAQAQAKEKDIELTPEDSYVGFKSKDYKKRHEDLLDKMESDKFNKLFNLKVSPVKLLTDKKTKNSKLYKEYKVLADEVEKLEGIMDRAEQDVDTTPDTPDEVRIEEKGFGELFDDEGAIRENIDWHGEGVTGTEYLTDLIETSKELFDETNPKHVEKIETDKEYEKKVDLTDARIDQEVERVRELYDRYLEDYGTASERYAKPDRAKTQPDTTEAREFILEEFRKKKITKVDDPNPKTIARKLSQHELQVIADEVGIKTAPDMQSPRSDMYSKDYLAEKIVAKMKEPRKTAAEITEMKEVEQFEKLDVPFDARSVMIDPSKSRSEKNISPVTVDASYTNEDAKTKGLPSGEGLLRIPDVKKGDYGADGLQYEYIAYDMNTPQGTSNQPVASHTQTFTPEPTYPGLGQERILEDELESQTRIEQRATEEEWKSDLIMSSAATAETGWPVAYRANTNTVPMVVGGNGRFITMGLRYTENPTQTKNEVLANAAKFGFSPEDIKAGMARMNQPIILRVITGTKKKWGDTISTDTPAKINNLQEFRSFVTALNRPSAASKTSKAEAAALGNLLSSPKGEKAVTWFGDQLTEQNQTILAVLAAKPKEAIAILQKYGIVTEGALSEWYDSGNNIFTTIGKDRLQRGLLGTIIPDAKKIDQLSRHPEVYNMVQSIVPHVMRARTISRPENLGNNLWDLTDDVREAVEMFNKIESSKLTPKEFFNQGSLFVRTDKIVGRAKIILDALYEKNYVAKGDKGTDAIKLYGDLRAKKMFPRWFKEGKRVPTKFIGKFKRFARHGIDAKAGQGNMWGNNSPESAFESEFSVKLGESGSINLELLTAPFVWVAKKVGESYEYVLEKATSWSEKRKVIKAETTRLKRYKIDVYEVPRKLRRKDKITILQFVARLNTSIIDVAGNARRKLMKMGPEGVLAVHMHDLALGSSQAGGVHLNDILNRVYNPLFDAQREALEDVLQSARTMAILAKKPLHKRPLTAEKALENLESYPEADRKFYGELAREVFDYSENLLKMRHQYGIINEKTYNYLSESGDYISSQYLHHEKDNVYKNLRITVPSSGIKALDEGSVQALEMHLPTLLADQTMRTFGTIFNNEASKALAKALKTKPNDLVGRLPRKGERGIPEGHEEFNYLEKGEKRKYYLTLEFAKEWVSYDPQIKNATAQIISHLSGASVLRFTATTGNPLFAIPNVMRDIAHSWFVTDAFSPHLPIATAEMAESLRAVAKDAWNHEKPQGLLRRYLLTGGGMEFLSESGGPGILDIRAREGKTKKMAEGIKVVGDVLSKIGKASELWVRLAIMHKMLKDGATEIEAVHAARSYLDFGRGGSMIKMLDHGMPYLNASFQATRGSFRAYEDNPRKSFIKTLWIMGVGMALFAYNRLIMGEDADKIPLDDRTRYHIIGLPLAHFKDKEGNSRSAYVRIAKDQSQGVILSLIEAMGDWMIGRGFNYDIIKRAQTTANPAGGLLQAPPLGEALTAEFTGLDLWKGKPVYKRTGKVKPEDETYSYINPFWDALGKITGTSPARHDTAIKKLFAPSNPAVDFVSIWPRLLMDKAGPQSEKTIFDALNYDAIVINKVLRVTGLRDAKDISGKKAIEMEVGSRRKAIRDDMKEALQGKDPHGEAKQIIAETGDRRDRARLKQQYGQWKELGKLSTKMGGLPELPFWKDLIYSNPESAARQFHEKMERSSVKTRIRLQNILRQFDSLHTPAFKKEYRILRGEYPDRRQ